MPKVVLGILTGILIFIAAGILATYWVGKMRRDMEQKKPRLAHIMAHPRIPNFPPLSELLYL
jgi:hypothetical protein